MTKVAIVGGREFNDYGLLQRYMSELHLTISEVVSGGAPGADKLAERYAEDYHLNMKVFHADWNAHGKAAGFIRNRDIVHYADVVVAFWDGLSPGTKHTTSYAVSHNKPVHICKYVPPVDPTAPNLEEFFS